MDQRGTGYSKPRLACPLTEAQFSGVRPSPNLAFNPTPEIPRGQDAIIGTFMRDCNAEITQGLDHGLDAYRTSESVHDLDWVRRALGLDTLQIYGISYGTRLGLEFLRQYPDDVSGAILDGLLPPDLELFASSEVGPYSAMEAVFSRCDGSIACQQNYPLLRQNLIALLEKLDAEPLVWSAPNGQSYPFYGGDIVAILQILLYGTEDAAFIPEFLRQVSLGNTELVVNLVGFISTAVQISQPMYHSVICAEEAAFVTRSQLAETVASYPDPVWQRLSRIYEGLDACENWPVTSVPTTFKAPVVSDVPVLLVNGKYDPATPVAWARRTLTTLSNATLIEPADSAHGALNSPCTVGIARAFLDNPTSPIDSTCLAVLTPPPFLTPAPDDVAEQPLVQDRLGGSQERASKEDLALAGDLSVGGFPVSLDFGSGSSTSLAKLRAWRPSRLPAWIGSLQGAFRLAQTQRSVNQGLAVGASTIPEK